ncbi:MAG: cytochrome c maturation protein CcmE [Dehalococcoidia bacterium]|nr:cytochrome c maturation protein CcmE [Dehalococcoidia bacterium]
MKKNKKFVIGGLIVLLATVVLGYVYFMTGNYYYTVGEYLRQEETLSGKSVKVSGVLLSKSNDNMEWSFTLQDAKDDGYTLAGVYSGTPPETFQVGETIIVEGRFDTDSRIFEASQIIVKCSSKYTPAT